MDASKLRMEIEERKAICIFTSHKSFAFISCFELNHVEDILNSFQVVYLHPGNEARLSDLVFLRTQAPQKSID